MATILEVLQLAQRYHIAGQPAAAEPLYRQVLQADPANCEALHLLGALKYRENRLDEAAQLISRAIELNPTAAHYHSNFALVLKSQGPERNLVKPFEVVNERAGNRVGKRFRHVCQTANPRVASTQIAAASRGLQ